MKVNQELITAFKRKYHYVIGNNLRPTGHGQRFAAMDLIAMCNEIDPEGDYGNFDSGMMNVDRINELAQKLGVI